MILDSGAYSSTLSVNYYNQFKTGIINNGVLNEVNVHGVAGKSTKK